MKQSLRMTRSSTISRINCTRCVPGRGNCFCLIENPVRHPYFVGKRKPETLLFNLVDDFSCEQNVAEKHPDVVARLTALAEGAREDLGDLNCKGKGIRPIGKDRGGSEAADACRREKDGPAASAVGSQNALEMIEGTRGGRHWVDAETAPPKSPEESLACLEIEPGMKLEIAAAEPIVRDPVAISFDHHGDMYVVEYGDYPVGPEDGGKPLSKDRPAERHRRRWSHGQTACLRRRPQLCSQHDAVSRRVIGGSSNGNPAPQRYRRRSQSRCSRSSVQWLHPRSSADADRQPAMGNGQLDLSELRTGRSRSSGQRTLKNAAERGSLQSSNHGPSKPAAALGQFGNTIDRWGNRFYCTNRNPIMTTLLSPKDLMARNPFRPDFNRPLQRRPHREATRVFTPACGNEEQLPVTRGNSHIRLRRHRVSWRSVRRRLSVERLCLRTNRTSRHTNDRRT